jgi:hypothetical protein
MPKVVPFPLARRRAFIRRHAAIMASLSVDAAERHLGNQIRIQVGALARRGVAREVVEQEQRHLAAAIRLELGRLGMARGGAA